jgi:hypothetical protein
VIVRSVVKGFTNLLLGGLLLPVLASADAAGVEFKLDYADHASCPSATDFRKRVEARVPTSGAAVPKAAKISFRIDFAQEGDALFGNLWIAVDGEIRSHRRIPAASCSDAVDSMAVIAAIVLEANDVPLDPEVRSETERASPTPTATSAARPPSNTTATQPIVPTASSPAAAPIEGRAVASGVLVTGVAPVFASPGVEAGGELRWNAGKLRGRAEVLYVPPVTVSVAGGDAEFHLVAARALFCVAIFETGRLSLDGCAGLDAGQLAGTGKGQRLQNQLTQHAAWLGAGLSAVPQIALTSAFSLELGGGMRVLGPTDHFVFRPGVAVHDVPRFSWDLGLGISIRPY